MRQKQGVFSLFLLSPSSRRAWIEIRICIMMRIACLVALLAEGVDRNVLHCSAKAVFSYVALLAEGVDRNVKMTKTLVQLYVSPSSRRAWIEISPSTQEADTAYVALLAEGVDRNMPVASRRRVYTWSPSSRRAWIEIDKTVQVPEYLGGRPPRGGRG